MQFSQTSFNQTQQNYDPGMYSIQNQSLIQNSNQQTVKKLQQTINEQGQQLAQIQQFLINSQTQQNFNQTQSMQNTQNFQEQLFSLCNTLVQENQQLVDQNQQLKQLQQQQLMQNTNYFNKTTGKFGTIIQPTEYKEKYNGNNIPTDYYTQNTIQNQSMNHFYSQNNKQHHTQNFNNTVTTQNSNYTKQQYQQMNKSKNQSMNQSQVYNSPPKNQKKIKFTSKNTQNESQSENQSIIQQNENEQSEKKNQKYQNLTKKLQDQCEIQDQRKIDKSKLTKQPIEKIEKKKKPNYLKIEATAINNTGQRNPQNDDVHIQEVLKQRKQLVAIQDEIDKILEQEQGTHGRRCQSEHLQGQLDFLERQKNKIMDQIDKDKKREDQLIQYVAENGGDVGALQKSLWERKQKEEQAWENYLNRFDPESHKKRMERNWNKDFQLPLSHKNTALGNDYRPFKDKHDWEEELEIHKENLQKIYGTDSYKHYQGENRKKEIEFREKIKKQREEFEKKQEQNKYREDDMNIQEKIKKQEELEEIEENEKIINQKSKKQIAEEKKQQQISQTKSQIIQNMSSKYDTENRHFSRCMEPHVSQQQQNLTNSVQMTQLRSAQIDSQRRSQEDYLHMTGISHKKMVETDYLAKRVSNRLEELRELKNLIKPYIKPKEFGVLEEKIADKLKNDKEPINIQCKGCLKANLALKIKTIVDKQHAQTIIGAEQVEKKQKIMRLLKKDLLAYYQCLEDLDNGGIKKKITKKEKKEIKEKWALFEKAVKENKLKNLMKEHRKKQVKEILSEHCPQCMRISILPKLDYDKLIQGDEYDDGQEFENHVKQNKSILLGQKPQKPKLNPKIEDQVIKQQFKKTFTADDMEYTNFIEKYAEFMQNYKQDKYPRAKSANSKQNKINYQVRNRDQFATQSAFFKTNIKYSETQEDVYDKYKKFAEAEQIRQNQILDD